MRVLIDTLTFLWWNLDAPKLSHTARKIIGDGQNEIFFSAVSAWEISIKYGKGRLTLPDPPDVYVPNRLAHYQFLPLPIQLSHTLQVHQLPDIHHDPFDRLLIIQSQIEQLPLLTFDQDIARYNVSIIW
jgi:PIN domain nuclease of toxin-antitoxin system